MENSRIYFTLIPKSIKARYQRALKSQMHIFSLLKFFCYYYLLILNGFWQILAHPFTSVDLHDTNTHLNNRLSLPTHLQTYTKLQAGTHILIHTLTKHL